MPARSPLKLLQHFIVVAGFLVAPLLLVGCATLPRNPVPLGLDGPAAVAGMPEVRAWAGRTSPVMQADFEASLQQERKEDFPVGPDGRLRYPHLALSGGGANGAFGAGFLSGWSQSGSRPVFKMVTGVSTGALMAPFAFVGPQYDALLKRFYTTTTNAEVYQRNSRLATLFRRDALAETTPLAALLERSVDADLLRHVADAHRQGRRLYIGTMDLDSRQFVVWNMGMIAASGRPESLALFRKIMLASSSVPIAFPPVFFDVAVDGRHYDEMHVDGFVGATVFLNVGIFNVAQIYRSQGRSNAYEDIYVIHNGQFRATPRPARRSLGGIALRVIDTASRAGLVGDLFREYAFAQRDGSRFHWVTIRQSVELPDGLDFDPAAMMRLYDVGFEAAQGGPQWLTEPPGFSDRRCAAQDGSAQCGDAR